MENPGEPEEPPAEAGEDEEARAEAGEDEEAKAEAVSQDMESGLQEMRSRAQEVDQELTDVRDDWQRKRQDPSVPGAEPDDDAQR
jgi:hypothetical protein